MGLRINTNVPSLIAQRNLRTTRTGLDKTLERLSSGSRINHAGDDAAGLAISESFRAQLRGLGQAERNAQDGVSLIQVAEGAMAEVSSILIRMRELAVQASSDTVGTQERRFMDVEFQQLMEEIDRIANSTEYNRVPLLNGTANVFEIQIGTRNNPITDRVKLFDASAADINIVALGINLASVADKTAAQNSLGSLDSALMSITSVRAEFGAMQNRLQSVINNIMISRENLSAANSRIRDADIAEETTELAKNQILMQTGVSVLTQANATVKSALGLLGQGGSA
ncbi:MAG: flagellin [Bdellovibrionales bacterium RIFOXYD1_FULL_53_11]|nr:MAG: flagellin [Bdellovibrionales bacterium RIFOXYD1_FULL_53_11]